MVRLQRASLAAFEARLSGHYVPVERADRPGGRMALSVAFPATLRLCERMDRSLSVAVFAVLLCGCPKTNTQEADAGASKSEEAGATSTPVASVTAIPIAPDAAVPLMEVTSDVKSRKDPRYAGLPLFEKLYVERTDRPTNSLKVEAVYDGLNRSGVTVTNRRQVLGQLVSDGVDADAFPAHQTRTFWTRRQERS